jgi:hypothetical protein
MPAVGQQAVADADQDGDQPGGEQQVAPPIHLGVLAHPDVMQHEVRPDGAEHPFGCARTHSIRKTVPLQNGGSSRDCY